jgi:DNA-binding XRE family transcriptional regulator
LRTPSDLLPWNRTRRKECFAGEYREGFQGPEEEPLGLVQPYLISPESIFGRRVRELRIERKLSQEKLAELAELHRNYVGGIERGERNVGLLNIVKLAHGLNVRPAKLIEPIR